MKPPISVVTLTTHWRVQFQGPVDATRLGSLAVNSIFCLYREHRKREKAEAAGAKQRAAEEAMKAAEAKAEQVRFHSCKSADHIVCKCCLLGFLKPTCILLR